MSQTTDLPRLAIIGTGTLSGAVTRVTSASSDAFAVTVVGRNTSAIDSIGNAARARAFALGSSSRFDGVLLPNMEDALSEFVMGSAFDALLICCSLQSPWEMSGTSAWGRLIREAGFGVTLPLQLSIAARVAHAATHTAKRPFIVNAAYPDVVNAALDALNVPILCGVGNVAILHALGGDRDVRLVAHHRHLAELAESGDSDWLTSADAAFTTRVATRLRSLPGSALNEVTAAGAVRLLGDLLYLRNAVHHVPGARGMIGGCAVSLHNGTLAPQFSPFDETEAIDVNRRASEREGAIIVDGDAVFSEHAHSVMQRVASSFPARIPVTGLDALATELVELRSHLEKE